VIVARAVVAIVGALIVGGVAIAAAGLSPLATFSQLVMAAVGTPTAIRNSLLQAVPITFTALGVAFAFRGGLFNLGGEGQLYAGALGGVAVALAGRSLPGPVLLPAVLLAGALGGTTWGALAGAMRAWLGLSEIISTIMLNFILFWVVSFLVRGPIKDPQGGGYPYTAQVVAGARLPVLAGAVPTGALLALVAAVVLWLLLERTWLGLEIRAVGESCRVARFAGVRVERRLFTLMAVAGLLGGLGGAAELAGNQHRLSDFFSPGWGYDAVAVALIGRGSPFGTLAAGLFFGGLESGSQAIQATAGVPDAVARFVQGAAVLLLIVANTDAVGRALRRLPLAGRRALRGALADS